MVWSYRRTSNLGIEDLYPGTSEIQRRGHRQMVVVNHNLGENRLNEVSFLRQLPLPPLTVLEVKRGP